MFFLLFLVISMGLAFVFSLVLEAPFMGLEKVLLYRPPQKPNVKQEPPAMVYHVSKDKQ